MYLKQVIDIYSFGVLVRRITPKDLERAIRKDALNTNGLKSLIKSILQTLHKEAIYVSNEHLQSDLASYSSMALPIFGQDYAEYNKWKGSVDLLFDRLGGKDLKARRTIRTNQEGLFLNDLQVTPLNQNRSLVCLVGNNRFDWWQHMS
jgi:hypothetical protein